MPPLHPGEAKRPPEKGCGHLKPTGKLNKHPANIPWAKRCKLAGTAYCRRGTSHRLYGWVRPTSRLRANTAGGRRGGGQAVPCILAIVEEGARTGEGGGGRATRGVEGHVNQVGADGKRGDGLLARIIADTQGNGHAPAILLGQAEELLRHVLDERAGEVVRNAVAGGRGTTLEQTTPIPLLKTNRSAPTIEKGGPDRGRNTGRDPNGSEADEVNHLRD